MEKRLIKFVQQHRLVVGSALVLFLIMLVFFYFQISGASEFVVFNVGQGDALLAKSGSVEALIDTGPDRSVLSGLGRDMPFFDRTIECVFITHPHRDHYGGLISVLASYEVANVFISGDVDDDPNWQLILKEMRQRGVAIKIIGRGDNISCGLMAFRVLWPNKNMSYRDPNDASLVMKLSFASSQRQFLLMGDAGFNTEPELLKNNDDVRAEVLKVGHHGSRFATSADFIKSVQPKLAVISVGKNKYGHPNGGVISRLEGLGVKVFRTDYNGDVHFKAEDKIDLFSKIMYSLASYY